MSCWQSNLRLTGLAAVCGSLLYSQLTPPPGGASQGLSVGWLGQGSPGYCTVAGSGRNPSPGQAQEIPASEQISV